LNAKKSEELAHAKAWLTGARKKIQGFNSEPLAGLVAGELWAAHCYQNEALMAARRTGGNVEFVFPEEGGTLYVDSWVIPAKAEHAREAHAFIDFVLDAKVAARTTETLLIAPVQKGVFDWVAPALRSVSQLQPSDRMMKRSEMIEDLGPVLEQYDRVWTEVKAGG
jgi:spermidine/putrescine transport system substrate-binding protein